MLRVTEKYRQLIEKFALQVLKSDEDLDAAHAVAGPLYERLSELGEDEKAYLEVLSKLIGDYERPLAATKSAPHEMLDFLMEQHSMRPVDLATLLEVPRSRVSEYLSGARSIPRKQLEVICRRFNVGPECFVRPLEYLAVEQDIKNQKVSEGE